LLFCSPQYDIRHCNASKLPDFNNLGFSFTSWFSSYLCNRIKFSCNIQTNFCLHKKYALHLISTMCFSGRINTRSNQISWCTARFTPKIWISSYTTTKSRTKCWSRGYLCSSTSFVARLPGQRGQAPPLLTSPASRLWSPAGPRLWDTSNTYWFTERGFHLVAYVNAQSTAYTINSTGKKKQFLEWIDRGRAHRAVACWGVGRQRKVIEVAGGWRSGTLLPAASRGGGRGSHR
jgi:hypothetical protein